MQTRWWLSEVVGGGVGVEEQSHKITYMRTMCGLELTCADVINSEITFLSCFGSKWLPAVAEKIFTATASEP